MSYYQARLLDRSGHRGAIHEPGKPDRERFASGSQITVGAKLHTLHRRARRTIIRPRARNVFIDITRQEVAIEIKMPIRCCRIGVSGISSILGIPSPSASAVGERLPWPLSPTRLPSPLAPAALADKADHLPETQKRPGAPPLPKIATFSGVTLSVRQRIHAPTLTPPTSPNNTA